MVDDLRLSLTYIDDPFTLISINLDITYYLSLILQRVNFINSQATIIHDVNVNSYSFLPNSE
jgi:hypothetical protein